MGLVIRLSRWHCYYSTLRNSNTVDSSPSSLPTITPPSSISNANNKLPEKRTMPQAPNRLTLWSKSQQLKEKGMTGARFEQLDLESQPAPLAAIELIKTFPIKQSNERIVYCDGLDGNVALGHPRIFLNLDQGKVISCIYCGLRFQKKETTASDH